MCIRDSVTALTQPKKKISALESLEEYIVWAVGNFSSDQGAHKCCIRHVRTSCCSQGWVPSSREPLSRQSRPRLFCQPPPAGRRSPSWERTFLLRVCTSCCGPAKREKAIRAWR